MFRYWARQDTKDTSKINYVLNWFSIGKGWAVFNFTSDDLVDGYMQHMINNAYIHSIDRRSSEWFVELDYPFPYPAPEKDESVLKTRHTESI